MTNRQVPEALTTTEAQIVVSDAGGPLARPESSSVDRLVERWLTRRSEATKRAYTKDLRYFSSWLGAPSHIAAVRQLLGAGHAGANALVDDYRGALVGGGLAPATVNRRLASLRSIVTLARVRGLVEWAIDVPGERVQTYRDTRGPGLRAVQTMLSAAAEQGGMKGLRDVALVQVLFTLGLRREEVASLDVEHFDRAGRLAVLGKGKAQRGWLTVPATVTAALSRYVDARGAVPEEPLFRNVDRAGKGDRLTAGGLYRVVRHLAELAGVPGTVSPHRLRHSAITHALDSTGGDVRRTKSFSRHARLDTVAVYDDARRDLGGEVANILAAALGDVGVEVSAGDGDVRVGGDDLHPGVDPAAAREPGQVVGNAHSRAQLEGLAELS